MTLLRALLLSITVMIATACSTAQQLLGAMPKPDARIQSGRITDLDMQALTMTFDVEVTNPYAVPLPMSAMRYELGAGEQAETPFLTGFAEHQGAVPAKGRKTLQIPVRVSFSELLATVENIRPGMVVPYRANLSFEVEPPGATQPIALPISHSGELPVPAPPEISVKQIEWETLSLARADGILKLDVRNPNEFAAQLKDMTYNLKLNGISIVKGDIEEEVDFNSNKTQSFDIPVSIKPLDLGTAVFTMLQKGQADYTMTGIIDLNTPFGNLAHNYDKVGQLQLTR